MDFLLKYEVFTSFILEKNLWAHKKLEILIHENNTLWEVTTPKYTVGKKKYERKYIIQSHVTHIMPVLMSFFSPFLKYSFYVCFSYFSHF